MRIKNLAAHKYRWWALVVIALGLAIVIIDNTVLNVSIPYILRDLNTTFASVEWVISGYSLTIATVLITIGRLGDMWGRRRIFRLGVITFATGSFIGSIAPSATQLIIGRAIIQAIGAAMTLTSALALLASEFKGRERAIAFGIWGAIAGASATVGPLLGGYLTTDFSWRWSLRINVAVGIAALIGSVFIVESKGEEEKGFDWWGVLLSGTGLFSIVFGFIQGRQYGWLTPNKTLSLFGINWPFTTISIVPVLFALGVVLLTMFILREHHLEKTGATPLLRMSMFTSRGFSIGLATLGILAFGQFGAFFVLPIYLENVLGLNALQTGVAFLPASISLFVAGSLSGFIGNKINIKWVVVIGMLSLSAGVYFLIPTITLTATPLTIMPPLILFGIGFGFGSAQMNNIIISSAPLEVAGEASASSTTARQVGSSIGVAIVGAVLTISLITNVTQNVQTDQSIPARLKPEIISGLKHIDIESGQFGHPQGVPPSITDAMDHDVKSAIVQSGKDSMRMGFYFILAGTALSFLLPLYREEDSRVLPNKKGKQRKNASSNEKTRKE